MNGENHRTDFFDLPLSQKKDLLLRAIFDAHAWHYLRNLAYRLGVEAKGVGPTISEAAQKVIEAYKLAVYRLCGTKDDHRIIFIMPERTRIVMAWIAHLATERLGMANQSHFDPGKKKFLAEAHFPNRHIPGMVFSPWICQRTDHLDTSRPLNLKIPIDELSILIISTHHEVFLMLTVIPDLTHEAHFRGYLPSNQEVGGGLLNHTPQTTTIFYALVGTQKESNCLNGVTLF